MNNDPIPVDNDTIFNNFTESLSSPSVQNYMVAQVQKNILENLTSGIDTMVQVNNPIHKTNKLIEDQNSIILDLRNQLDGAKKEVEDIHYQLMKAVAQNEVLLKTVDKQSEKIDCLEESNKELRNINAKITNESKTSKFLWAIIPSALLLAIEHIHDIYSIIVLLINRI